MDGIHDLGGRKGFGAIEVAEKEVAFHEPWEARMRGIVRAISAPGDWSIDWFRHCRELIDPVDYLTRPYYDQWLQTYAAMMVNSGVATVEELSTGKMKAAVTGLRPPMAPEEVETAKKTNKRFDRKIDEPPAFSVGDTVRTQSHGAPGHTRLPAYARGRRGTIKALHGAHVLPDSKAHGGNRAEPLYTVGFDAAELWPDAEDMRDRVNLNLWQSYLERG